MVADSRLERAMLKEATRSFNGAATQWSRIEVQVSMHTSPWRRSFNGAATQWSRIEVEMFSAFDIIVFAFNGAATQWSRIGGGPSRVTCTLSVLQWGRDPMVADRRDTVCAAR